MLLQRSATACAGPRGLAGAGPLSANVRPVLPQILAGARSRQSASYLHSQRVVRPGNLVILREAATTEELKGGADSTVVLDPSVAANGTVVYSAAASSNGNGNGATASTSTSNGTSNGNGNGNGNGVYTMAAAKNGNGNGNGVAAAAAAAAVAAAAAASNGNGNGNGHKPISLQSLDIAMDPSVAGQLETVAATAASSTPRALPTSAAGTPYKNPGGRWSQFKTYSVFQRTLEIWSFAFQFGWRYFLLGQKWTYGKEGMTKEAVSARKREVAVWLREGLVKLGPTFIKVGQQFSTRVDVLSPEFIKELEKLQDNVPPFDSNAARAILEQSLGRPISEVFDELDDEPIAAASLGQVYLARLKGSQQKVVVKVQRPGLKELFDIDLKNIRALAVWLQKVDPKTDGAARDWVAIYDECSRILYQEIDYKLEGQNADRFRANFAGVPWVKVPEVYWEHSSSQILVLEYCPGIKINDAAAIDKMGLDRKRLARLSVESYLQQILRHAFFHADPHPGNVACDAGCEGGRLIYYDFGMMGTLPTDVKSGLLELFYGVYNRDPDRCLEALTTMGVYVPTGDKVAVRRTAEYFLKGFSDRLDTQRKERESAAGTDFDKTFKPQRTKDEAKERRRQILSTIGEDLLLAANDQPFRFPATFTFVVRSFTVLDGIGKSLDARFDISEIAAPYARELLLEGSPAGAKLNRELKKGFAEQTRAVRNLFVGPNKIDDIASAMQKLERGDLKLRVRALEAERALTRVQAWQRVIGAALLTSTLVNVGTVLSVSALATGASMSFAGAAFFGFMALKNYLKVAQLEKKEAQLAGAV